MNNLKSKTFKNRDELRLIDYSPERAGILGLKIDLKRLSKDFKGGKISMKNLFIYVSYFYLYTVLILLLKNVAVS